GSRIHPLAVAPLVLLRVPNHRGRFRRSLAIERVGVGLELLKPGKAGADVVLVRGPLADAGDEDFPNAAAALPHGMAADVPLIEIAGDGDVLGVRRPNGEAHTGETVRLADVRAESAVCLVERAFGVKIEVGVRE